MWRTEYGERILEGAEAKLFAETLLSLLDELLLDEFDEYPLGIRVFDNLTYGQKIYALSTIANGLLRKDIPIVELTAVLEGAIAAVFEHLKNLITLETDDEGFGTDWREMVVAVRKECEGEEIPLPTCRDMEEWDIEVEQIIDGILWDRDFDDDDIYTDHPPEKSEWLRHMARIPDNYYMAIADDLKDEEIEVIRTELRKLCRSVVEAE
jgi:hypothetical protein